MAMNDPIPYTPPTILAEQMREAAAVLADDSSMTAVPRSVEVRPPHVVTVHHLTADVADLRAERDVLAAEVQRAREQKPVRWALLTVANSVALTYADEERAEAEARAHDLRLAPLYLAPVVRDHSGVIAQCEEALEAWARDDDEGVPNALRAALAALRGAS